MTVAGVEAAGIMVLPSCVDKSSSRRLCVVGTSEELFSIGVIDVAASISMKDIAFSLSDSELLFRFLATARAAATAAAPINNTELQANLLSLVSTVTFPVPPLLLLPLFLEYFEELLELVPLDALEVLVDVPVPPLVVCELDVLPELAALLSWCSSELACSCTCFGHSSGWSGSHSTRRRSKKAVTRRALVAPFKSTLLEVLPCLAETLESEEPLAIHVWVLAIASKQMRRL